MPVPEETEFTQEGTQGTRQWFLTINHPEDDTLPQLPGEVFAIWQREEGKECHTPHIHATLLFKNAVSFNKMKDTYPRANIQRVRKTDKAIAYCSKEDTRVAGPWERGTRPKGKGKRTDIEDARDSLLDGADDEYMLEHHCEVMARYPRFLTTCRSIRQRKQLDKELLPNPYVWQREVMAMVAGTPDSRKVHWFYDSKGDLGKSALGRHLMDFHGAFYQKGGRTIDITYSYNYERIVILDYVRDQEEYVNYGVMEMFKDGVVQSNKYESCIKRCNPPWVLVFANFMPIRSKLSEDRWVVRTLTEADKVC